MKCGQAGLLPDVSSTSVLAFARLPLPTILMKSSWGVMLLTPDRRVDHCLHSGHPPRPQLPQLTPIEFQDRGSNPVLLSQWIQKSTALTIRPRGTLKRKCHKTTNQQRKTCHGCACNIAVWPCEVVILLCFRKSDAFFALINIFSWNCWNFRITVFPHKCPIFHKN